MALSFTPVPPELLNKIWDRVKDLLILPIEVSNNKFDIDSIKMEILGNLKVLWILFEGDDNLLAAITTSIEQYKNVKMMRISFAGGENVIENVDLILDKLREFAKSCGCDGIEAFGRKGWEKILKNKNFSATYVCLEEYFNG